MSNCKQLALRISSLHRRDQEWLFSNIDDDLRISLQAELAALKKLGPVAAVDVSMLQDSDGEYIDIFSDIDAGLLHSYIENLEQTDLDVLTAHFSWQGKAGMLSVRRANPRFINASDKVMDALKHVYETDIQRFICQNA